MVTQFSRPITAPEVVYPESDGKPMANNTKQFEWIVRIKENLDVLFIDDPNVLVVGDLLWYPVEGRNTLSTAPDVMVVFGRPKGHRGSYKQWEEGNIPPQVVFEILSPGNTNTEMAKKLLFYDRYNVEEYYIYDPDTNQLDGWLRGNEGLDPILLMSNWVSPRLGICFDLSAEVLQILRPDGQRFLSYDELAQQANQAEQRADQAEQRADQAEQRADQAEQRADRLAERLRAMGINPDDC